MCRNQRWPAVVQPAQNFWRTKYFDFKWATVFCFGHRFTKHKTTRYARNLWGHGPLGPPGYAYGGRNHIFRLRLGSCSKIFESGSASGFLSNLWISPVQTPATIDATESQQCLFLAVTFIKIMQTPLLPKMKMTPDLGPIFHKILTTASDSDRKKDAQSCRSRLRHSGSMTTSGRNQRCVRDRNLRVRYLAETSRSRPECSRPRPEL